MGGKMVDDELPQVLGVTRGHPDEIVGGAGQVKDHQHSGQFTDGGGERVDLLARMCGEANRDQGLQGPAERGEIDLRVKAADHTALAQSTKPAQRRGGRDADTLRETLVGDPSVGCEQLENRSIDVVHGGLLMIRHERDSPPHDEESSTINVIFAESTVC